MLKKFLGRFGLTSPPAPSATQVFLQSSAQVQSISVDATVGDQILAVTDQATHELRQLKIKATDLAISIGNRFRTKSAEFRSRMTYASVDAGPTEFPDHAMPTAGAFLDGVPLAGGAHIVIHADASMLPGHTTMHAGDGGGGCESYQVLDSNTHAHSGETVGPIVTP